MVSRSVLTSKTASPRRAPPTTRASRSSTAPAASPRRSSVRTSASASTRPVFGDHSAARARTCGSRCWMKSAPTTSRPSRAIGLAERGDRLDRGNLVLVDRDDQLAAALVGHAVLGAEAVQPAGSLDAQLGLQRPGRVVESGVDHAAVVRARLDPGPRVLFGDRGRVPREAMSRAAARPVTPAPITNTSIAASDIAFSWALGGLAAGCSLRLRLRLQAVRATGLLVPNLRKTPPCDFDPGVAR